MKIKVGLDIGGSTTKIVGMQDGKIIAKQSNANGSWDVAVTDDLQSLSGESLQLVATVVLKTLYGDYPHATL